VGRLRATGEPVVRAFQALARAFQHRETSAALLTSTRRSVNASRTRIGRQVERAVDARRRPSGA
jgi:hypothetical protein